MNWHEKHRAMEELGEVRFHLTHTKRVTNYGTYLFPVWTVEIEGVQICESGEPIAAVFSTQQWGTPAQAVNGLWQQLARRGRTRKGKITRWIVKDGSTMVYRWEHNFFKDDEGKQRYRFGWMPYMPSETAQ